MPEGPRLQRALRLVVYYGLQPALILGVFAVWAAGLASEKTAIPWLLGVQALLIGLEARMPARPAWRLTPRARGFQLLSFLVLGAGIGIVGDAYRTLLAGPLASLRAAGPFDVWPHHWPGVLQILLVFLASEFLWYWLHRAEHRWAAVWRVSGHGAHHAFKKLGALNSGLNHPFEFVLLVAPAATIELLFGVGDVAAAGVMLFGTQAAIAHANVPLNHRVIGWLFTTNRFHIHHHSAVLAESNTNYGCAAIVWDRLFGTFRDADTVETGTGPTEPTAWQKLAMPFVEPSDTRASPAG